VELLSPFSLGENPISAVISERLFSCMQKLQFKCRTSDASIWRALYLDNNSGPFRCHRNSRCRLQKDSLAVNRLDTGGRLRMPEWRHGFIFCYRHVPDTFQLGAILEYSAYLAGREINNLRVFNKRNIPTPPASTLLTTL
jgi:hypothetical protein